MAVLGRELCLARIRQAEASLQSLGVVENSHGWSAAHPGEGPPIRRLRPVGALRILFVHRERSLARFLRQTDAKDQHLLFEFYLLS
jgi:hypothetical protein